MKCMRHPKIKHGKQIKHLTWNQAMVIILAAFLFAMALKTISDNTASIEGYSVLGEQEDTPRMATTTTLLIVIFAFFGLFIMAITKRLDGRHFRR